MNNGQLNKVLQDLKKDYESKKVKAKKENANYNNPYKVGDIVEDHMGKLKIESWSYSYIFNTEYLQCVYKGQRLTKDLKPHKKESLPVFQSNIKKETT